MPRIYKRKLGSRSYRDYTNADLQRAVKAVKIDGFSLRDAAERFHVKKSTLHNKIKGKHMKPVGGPTTLSPTEETAFTEHILTLSNWGYPMTITDIRMMVKNYLDKCGKTVKKFKNNYPGRDWALSFVCRKKDILTPRMCQNISRSRAAVAASQVADYFENLKKVLKDIPASNIINYDETNLSDEPGRKKIICKRGCKYPERIMNSTKSATSIMFAAAADGTVLPPYVVYKAENLWSSWTQGGPKSCRYNRTRSGWFDQFCFEDWFFRVMLRYCKKQSGKCVVIGDNLSSHFSMNVLDACKKHNIDFVFLPPNSTHLMQPLDVAYFGPMKKMWRNILEDWKKGAGKNQATVSKDAFPQLLKKLVDKLKTKDQNNIQAGFKKCGLYPFNPNEVLNRLPRVRNEQDSSEEVNTAVSETVIDILNTMRYSPGQTRRQRRKKINIAPGKSVTSNMNEDNSSPTNSETSSDKEESFEEGASNSNEEIESNEDSNGEEDRDEESIGEERDEESNGEETDEESNGEETDEESNGDEKMKKNEAKGKEKIEVNDWILVPYGQKHYVGKVTSVHCGRKTVTYYRKRGGSEKFRKPNVDDTDVLKSTAIVVKLPKPEFDRYENPTFNFDFTKYSVM